MRSILSFITMVCAVLMLLGGCASQTGGSHGEAVSASAEQSPRPLNDFPTQARVEYVFQCMRDHGGQNYDNLYHCSCMLDELARHMNYQEYSEAVVFRNLRSMPGEQGGLFRDPPQARKLRNKLKQLEQAAEDVCFVK